MTFETILEDLSEETDRLIDEYAQNIADDAQENPREVEELPAELVAALILLWERAIDDIAADAVDETNEQLGDQEGSITEENKEDYKLVGGYFFLEAMRRSFHRIHGTAIALQVEEEDRDEEIADAIQRSKDDVSTSAFTELAFASGAFMQREQIARGIQNYRWKTRGDDRVRPSHRANESKIFSWESAPATGHPGTAINCFPSETKFISPIPVRKLFRRRYTGELTEFITDSGKTIRCTPNHPIFCNGIFVPAHQVNVGDDVVEVTSDNFLSGIEDDPQNRIAAFEKVFGFLEVLFNPERVGGTAVDFHGDGVIDEQVDIIEIDSFLRDNDAPIIDKCALDDFFALANMRLEFLPSDGSLLPELNSLGFTSEGFISLFSKLFSFVNSHSSHSDEVSLRAISEINSIFLDDSGNDGSGYRIPFRECQDTDTGSIIIDNLFLRKLFMVMWSSMVANDLNPAFSDELANHIGIDGKFTANLGKIHASNIKRNRIVDKRISVDSSCHVYNLESFNNQYIIPDFSIVGNCRCSAIPVLIEGNKSVPEQKGIIGNVGPAGIAASDMSIKNKKTGDIQSFKPSKNIEVKAMSESHVEIRISGDIGGGGYWEPENETLWEIESFSGITDKTKDIKLTINSSGGNYTEGLAMYRFFKDHPAKITTIVEDWAASAAVFPFLAGDVRIVPEHTELGIHLPYDPSCFCGINHEEAQELVDYLKPYSDEMVGIYLEHSRIDEESMRELLRRESMISSNLALKIGFATAVIPEDVTDEIKNQRSVAIAASMKQSAQSLINSVKDGDKPMSDTKGDKGGSTVAEVQARYDVLAFRKEELETENAVLKAKVEKLESGQAELRASVEAEVLAERNQIDDIKAKAATIEGLDIKGNTAHELMLSAIAARSKADMTGFAISESDSEEVKARVSAMTKSVFEDVIAQAGSKQADSVYGGGDSGKKAKSDPWAKANEAV